MSKDTKEKEVKVNVKLPRTGYPKRMFFNRFRVEKIDGMCLMYFGLLAPSIGLTDYYCCVIGEKALQDRRDSLVTYLDQMGRAKENPTPWQASPLAQAKTDVADMINMAHGAGMAEMVLSVFSQWALNLAGKEKSSEPLEAEPVALLRSDLEIQKQFIEALYA